MASAATCGLILLGNSGVGKSFLANRLLDDDGAFESKFSVRSVTRHTEWKDMSGAIGKHIYSVANIPGLVEANQKLIDENRIEIMKAFEQCPFAIVLFVFGSNNGRIRGEDLVAFMRINDAYVFSAKSLILIINGIPSNRPPDYEEKTTELLQELTDIKKTHIYFIEKATSEKSKNDIHNLLYEVIEKCEPTYHKRKHDIELLADEISRLKKESEHRQDQLLAQQHEHEKQEKFNVPSGSTLDLHQPSAQQLFTTIIKPKSDIIDDNKQFDEMMKTMEAEHNRNMERLKRSQQNRNTDEWKHLTDQLKIECDLSKELLEQMSSTPQVIVVREEQRDNVFQKAVNAVSGLFFRDEHRSCKSKHSKNLRHDNSEDNFHSSASRSLNPHHRNPTNN
ncbi:unnamed protein product [Adineta steineri]|uniref:AIG1-type G domain-containing protein n=1 Tax=Adineta steineri TaxID=433720 RepID=A0A819B1S8_9BILA|nr:unnamed protein product [Adineta steineri]CAF3794474.1 unnamed protein product [Adineta steineri]